MNLYEVFIEKSLDRDWHVEGADKIQVVCQDPSQVSLDKGREIEPSMELLRGYTGLRVHNIHQLQVSQSSLLLIILS